VLVEQDVINVVKQAKKDGVSTFLINFACGWERPEGAKAGDMVMNFARRGVLHNRKTKRPSQGKHKEVFTQHGKTYYSTLEYLTDNASSLSLALKEMKHILNWRGKSAHGLGVLTVRYAAFLCFSNFAQWPNVLFLFTKQTFIKCCTKDVCFLLWKGEWMNLNKRRALAHSENIL